MRDATLVISGWSAASAYGLGAGPFAAGVRGGRTGLRDLPAGADGAGVRAGDGRAGLVPGFDVTAVLGKKGTRSMDRLTGLTVATAGALLAAHGPGVTGDPEAVGLVLGTASGSVQSIMDFTRDSLTGEKPFYVDPARFPNTVMNRAAGQCAIWYGLKGPNTTVAGGAPTGLLALNYTARLWRRGHAEVLLCGAAEEFSVQRARLEAARGGTEPLGEGCAMFLVESERRAREHGRAPLATVLGSRFRAFGAPEDAGRALAAAVRAVLRHTDTDPDEVRLTVPAEPAGALGDRERAAVAEVLGGAPEAVRCRPLLGDTGPASAAFQLAAALAAGAARPDLAGAAVLVTSADRAGTAGCTLLRLRSAQPAPL